jgi:hypothetical protein
MSDLTPYHQARRIPDSSKNGRYGEGQRIVETLLSHRGMEDLSLEELELLFKGDHWRENTGSPSRRLGWHLPQKIRSTAAGKTRRSDS